MPLDYYELLDSQWPAYDNIFYEPYKQNYGYSKGCLHVLDNNNVSYEWKEFFRYHSSTEFLQEVIDLFYDELYILENKFRKQLKLLKGCIRSSANYGQRNIEGDVELECQFYINTPVEYTSTVRGPHLDNNYKLYNGLFYMRNSDDDSLGRDLLICKLTKDSKFIKKPLPGFYSNIEVVKTIKYEKNTLVFYLNTSNALHAVSNGYKTKHFRKYISLVGECFQFFNTMDRLYD